MRLRPWIKRLLGIQPGGRAGWSGRYDDQLFPRLFVRELEQRRVLSISPGPLDEVSQALVIDAGTADGESDTYHIARQDDQIEITVNEGSQTETVYSASLDQSTVINGSEDDDLVIVDLSGGDPVPAGGIAFHGDGPGGSGEGFDQIVMDLGSSEGLVQSVTHRFESIGDGFIDLTFHGAGSEAPPSAIAYTGVESVEDFAGADELVFQFTADDQVITLSDAGDPDDGQSAIASSLSPTVTYAGPAESLVIQTEDLDGVLVAPSGTESTAMEGVVIEITGLDTEFTGDVYISGQDDTAVYFSALADPGDASSTGAVTNGSFETGDFTDWTEIVPPGGSAEVVTTHTEVGSSGQEYSAVDGDYFALLKTDGPGSQTTASQTVTLEAGDTISGYAFFDGGDYLPFNDNAQVVIMDENGNVVATVFDESVSTVGDYGETDWTYWEYTATTSGAYTVQAQVANDLDSVLDSYMGLDAVSLSGGDTTAPTVTIDQAAGQPDPTNASPIDFTVVFSEPVTDFATGDVTLSGSAGATTAIVTETGPYDGTTYLVAVNGMTSDGAVIASIVAGVAHDSAGNPNQVSTSADNQVFYDSTPPWVASIERADPDPTIAPGVNFTVTFSEPVDGVGIGDFVIDASGVTDASVSGVSGSGTTYTVTVDTGTADGTLSIDFDADAAGGVTDAAGNVSVADFTDGESYTIATTEVVLIDGDLVVRDIRGMSADTLTIRKDGGNIVIEDPNLVMIATDGTQVSEHEVVVPISAITGSILVQTYDRNDSLNLDYLAGGFFAVPVVFQGGGQDSSPGDQLTLTGGNFDSITHSFHDSNSGDIDLDGTTVSYTELEPVLMNVGSANEIIFELPSGTTDAHLQDDSAFEDLAITSQIRSPDGDFERTTFTNPSVALTVRGGDGADVIDVDGLDAGFDAALGIDDSLGGDPVSVTFTGATDIGSGQAQVQVDEIHFTTGSLITTDNVTLNAKTWNITSSGTTDVAANQLTADAVTGITLGTDVARIDASVTNAGNISIDEASDVELIDVVTYDGSIQIVAAGTVTATSVESTNTSGLDMGHDISLTATGDTSDVLVTSITANGGADVSLSAGDDVLDTDPSDGNVLTADALQVTATSATPNALDGDFEGVQLDTAVAQLKATVEPNSGNIQIEEFDEVQLGDVETYDGFITVTAAGTLSVTDGADGDGFGVVAGMNGNVLLAALAGDVVVTAKVSSGTGHITITAGDDVDQNADVSTVGGTIFIAAAGATADGISGIDMDSATSTSSGGGNIVLAAGGGGDILLGLVDARAAEGEDGSVSLTAEGSILDANEASLNVAARELRMAAGGTIGHADDENDEPGVNVNAIDTDVSYLAATSADGIYVLETGQDGDGVTLRTIDPVDVQVVHFNSTTTALTELVDLSPQSDLETTEDGSIKVVASAGSITVEEGDADHSGVLAGGSGNVLLEARAGDGDVVLDADVQSGTGHITITAGDDVDQNANVSTAAPGTILVSASNVGGADGIEGIDMQPGTSTTSTGESVRLEATGESDILLGEVSGTSVSLLAERSIVDNNTAAVNVEASVLQMVADSDGGGAGRIGMPAAGAIDTDVTTLAAVSAEGIYVLELDTTSADGLTVDDTGVITVERANFNSTLTPVVDTSLSDLETTGAGSIKVVATMGSIIVNDGDGDGTGVLAGGAGSIWLEAQGLDADVEVKAEVGTLGTGSIDILAEDTISLHRDLSTVGGDINLHDRVILIETVQITSGSDAGGNITFDATVDGVAIETNSLTLTAGSGDITFKDDLGSLVRLNNLVITTANDVTVGGSVKATSFQQLDGTGTTRIEAPIDTTSAGLGLAVRTKEILVNADVTTGGGQVILAAYDDFVLGMNVSILSADGDVTVRADAGALTMGAGSTIDAGSGAIELSADQNVTLANVLSATTLTVTSTSGAISDLDISTIEVGGLATFLAGLRTTLGDSGPSDTTNFGSLRLGGGDVEITEDSEITLVGANVESLELNSPENILIQENAARAIGSIALNADGDIVVHNFLPLGESEMVGGDILFVAGGVIRIENFAVLESSTGKVTNEPPLLRIGEVDPDDVVVPGDRTQDLTGTVGGIEAEGDNLEQGANFTVTVVWDDGTTSVVTGVNAGDTVVWFVNEDGSQDVGIARGDGAGPIDVLVTREYPVEYLITVTETELVADVEVENDESIRLFDSTGVDLNRVDAVVETSFTGELFRQAVILLETETRNILGADEPVLVLAETSTPPIVETTQLEEIPPGQETIGEEERVLYIVKVESDGQESQQEVLPKSALAKLKALFDRLREKKLPSGLYRIYWKEPGFPGRKVIEFYKSGDSIGDPVREPGRGSNRPDEARAAAPDEPADVAHGQPRQDSRTALQDRRPPPLSDRPGTELFDRAVAQTDANRPPQTVRYVGDIPGAEPHAGNWAEKIDRAMEVTSDHSFSKVARLCRRMRS